MEYFFRVVAENDSAQQSIPSDSKSAPASHYRMQPPFESFPTVSSGSLAIGNLISGGGNFPKDVILVGESDGEMVLKMLRGQPGGTFFESDLFVVNGATTGLKNPRLHLVDFDHQSNGLVDVIISGTNADNLPETRLLLNQGGANFSPSTPLPPMTRGAMASGDIDLDGDVDVVMVGENLDGVYLLRNETDNATFDLLSERILDVKLEKGSAIALGDYNKDGRLDLALTGFDPDTGNTRLLVIPQINGEFDLANAAEPLVSQLGLGNASLRWADINLDGNLDLIAMGSRSNVAIEIQLLEGTGNSVSPFNLHALNLPIHSGVGGTESMTVGDVNADGFFDIVVMGIDSSSNQRVVLLLNPGETVLPAGNLTWALEEFFIDGALAHGSLALADMNQDGDVDLLLNGQDPAGKPQIFYLENQRFETGLASLLDPSAPILAMPNPPIGPLATFEISQPNDGVYSNGTSFDFLISYVDLTDGMTYPLITAQQTSPMLGLWNRSGAGTFTHSLTLRDNADFDVQVRAINPDLKPSAWSNTISVSIINLPPGDIQSFSAKTGAQVELTWLSPGGDLDTGRVESYEIVYSVNPIITDGDFTAASPISNPPSQPKLFEEPETIMVAEDGTLVPGTNYYFAIRGVDRTGGRPR